MTSCWIFRPGETGGTAVTRGLVLIGLGIAFGRKGIYLIVA